MQMRTSVWITLVLVLVGGLTARAQTPHPVGEPSPPPVPMTPLQPQPACEIVRAGNYYINLSQVAYVRFVGFGAGARSPRPATAFVHFLGSVDCPVQITGEDAEVLRNEVTLKSAPLPAKVLPAEASRRGYGNPNSNTFGGLGVPAQGGGIFLTGSNPGTPAASLGLEYGDVIVSINGTYVNTQAEYVAAVHNSPDVMNFVLRNVRTGQLQSMSVRLARGQ
jgi:hypothetical protein